MTTNVTRDGYVVGTTGNDSISSGYTDANGDKVDGNDAILAGTTGNDDVIVAGPGNDFVDAGNGNDLIYGGAGRDTLLGNGGADTIYGDKDPAGVTVPGGSYYSNDCGPDGTVLYNDLIKGGDGNDLIYGEASNDTLYGCLLYTSRCV